MNEYHAYSDAELVILLKQGEKAAFEVIYRRYVSDLYRYARKNIDMAADCEEMVQDVFLSLWTRREEITVGPIKHYLLTAIRYKIIRYFRHKAVKNRYAEHYRWFEVAYETMDKDEIDHDTIHEMVAKRIKDLPDRCQMVIQLRITENLSYKEIASRMNITTKTVEMHMSRAFAYLRQSYDRLYKIG